VLGGPGVSVSSEEGILVADNVETLLHQVG